MTPLKTPLRLTSNTQPPEKSVPPGTDSLEVHSVFRTVQGEGPFAGHPAVFVRLTGCNLQCPGCDTEYTSKRTVYSVLKLVDEVLEKCEASIDLVVITGGEPFRQPISNFVRELLERDKRVQLETNGSLFLEDFPFFNPGVTVVVSPKTPKVHPMMFAYAKCFKYVLDHRHVSEEDGLPTDVLGTGHSPARPDNSRAVYVTPADVADEAFNAKNTEAAVRSCMRHGYILNVQLHKVLGLP